MFVSSQFRPGWWARNRHVQTIWGSVFRQPPKLPPMERRRLELDDGDFIDVDIHLLPDRPTVLLLHGLEGSIDSPYMRGVVSQLVKDKNQVAVMHFRGCSGESNRLLRSYNSGVSDDLQMAIGKLTEQGITVNYLVGFSVGGNVLLKWLGENHPNHRVCAAVAVSVPMLLDECVRTIDQGFSRIYSRRLLKTLKIKTHEKKCRFADQVPLDNKQIDGLDSFWEFDDKVTAPLHGFRGANDYYGQSSSRQFLKYITVPTLIIQSKDDPFMNRRVIPEEEELSPEVQLELADKGGHVGFVSGKWPWNAEYYLDSRISEFLRQRPAAESSMK